MPTKKRTWGRRAVFRPGEKNAVNFSNIFVGFTAGDGAKMFNDWIDKQGRNNGNNENDCITCPVYIIESILRDYLNLPNNQIHHQSFDVHGNTTDGTLKDWSFTGGIYEVENSRDILENILIQCKSSLYREANGKVSLIVNDTIDYTRHNITGSNLISNAGFETTGGGAPDVFGSWSEGNYHAVTRKIVQTSDEFTEGVNSCWFDANANDGTTDFYIYQTSLNLSANTPYRLEFDYYFKARTQGSLMFYLDDITSGDDFIAETSISEINTKFETITRDFITTANVSTVRFRIGFDNETTGDVYIDNVRLYKVKQYYLFDKNSNIANLNIYQSDYEDLVNEVFVNYWLDRGSDKYVKTAFISSKKKFSGAYLTEDLDTTEITFNVTDHSVFSDNDIIMIDREVCQINGAPAANQIVINDTAGNRDQERNSKAATHLNGAPIFTITEDSDDGEGSTADTTREQEATEIIWKYNTNNKFEIDADWIIDKTTAVALRNYYHDYYSIPHWIIEFDCFLESSDIKNGSIIRIDDSVMDDFLKCGGESWSGKDFRVKKISRSGIMDFHILAEEI